MCEIDTEAEREMLRRNMNEILEVITDCFPDAIYYW